MQDANSLPEIIEYLNRNMIAAAYVVHVPDEYWTKKSERYKAKHLDATDEQIYQHMELVKDQLARELADVMAGKNNVGKFL